MSGRPGPGLRAAAVAATASAIGIASWLTVATPEPSLLSPYSLAVVIPYLWAGSPIPAFVLYAAVFLVPGARLVTGGDRPPGASAMIFGGLALLSGVFAVWGIRPGLIHYGGWQTIGILLADALLISVLAWLLIRARSRPTFTRLLAFHGLQWAWFAWIGLPWLRQLL